MKTIGSRRGLAVTIAVLLMVLATVAVATALTPDHEIPGTALPVGAGSQVVTSSVSAIGPADDVYNIQLEPGDRLSASVSTNDTAHVALNLYSPGALSISDPTYLVQSADATSFPLAWSYTATVGGLHYPNVRALEGTATYSLTFRHFRRTTVTLTAPSAVAYGGTASMVAQATDSAGQVVTSGAITFYYSYDNAAWKYLGAKPIATTGNATASFKPSRKTYFKALFNASGDNLTSAFSSVKTCAPRVYVTVPTAPTTAVAWTKFTCTGYLKPRHAASAHTVVLQAYRYEGGSWVLKKTASTTNSNYSTYTRYVGYLTLPGPGAKWKIRAYCPGDSLHAATYSGYRSLTVPVQRAYSVSGRVSDSSPSQRTNVTAYATVKDRTGHVIPGAAVKFVWHYKTVTQTEYGRTNSAGVATSTRYIASASIGYKVVISLTASSGGGTASGSTYFIPH